MNKIRRSKSKKKIKINSVADVECGSLKEKTRRKEHACNTQEK
jgi:hypothetical protein